MDSRNYRNSPASRIYLSLICYFLAGYSLYAGSDPYASWDATLTPKASNPFPTITPFEADYRFGWEGVSAGGASVKVTSNGSGGRSIEAVGGPDAWIRKLWDYQANYSGGAGAHGEVPSWFHMDEHVSKRDILSDAVFKPGSVFACHRLLTEKKPWELIALPGVRDLFAAMLFVRSQPLHDGDKLRLTVFPDQSPYLVNLTVTGHETLTMRDRKIPAIRFSIRIQTIETHGDHKGRLAPHKKFHSGRIWMSDDAERLPLRAEVDIFVGEVFAEMVSCKMQGGEEY